MEGYVERGFQGIRRTQILLFCFFIFCSFFETYLTPFFGNGTKFYLLFVLAVFLLQSRFCIRINKIWCIYFVWFIFKFFSVIWSDMSNSDFKTHLLSQIGMVLFVVVMLGRVQDKNLLYAILQTNLWVSFVFGVLSVFFRGAFLDEVFVARQVLTLFGQQNDPNNCAAFLLIGITLALYSATVERRLIPLNGLIAVVNTYALMLTSSRAGFLTLGVILVSLVFIPQVGDRIQIKKALQKLAVVVLAIAVSVFVIQRFLPQANIERLFTWSGYEGGSGRDIRWQRAMELFIQRPLFGWGWGGYSTGVGAIHNTFLTSLCDVGIFGTFLFIVPLFLIGFDALKLKNGLAFLILITGIFPSFVIDAINKRFFWNAIVFSAMLIAYQHDTTDQVSVWGFLDENKKTESEKEGVR